MITRNPVQCLDVSHRHYETPRWVRLRDHGINGERAEALKKVKELCKEFGFTAEMLKGALKEKKKRKGV